MLFLLATTAACASLKPETRAGSEAIYDNFNGSVTYGDPKQIALIRARMESLCSASLGEGIQGLPPAQRETLIQIDDYALVDGACGDPSLHMVLIERGPEIITWLSDSCGRRGDVRVTPLREYLSGKDGCWISDDVVDRMLQIRSGVTPKHYDDASARRFILYNHAWIEMSERARRGDVPSALHSAMTALRYQPSGIHYVEPCIAELRHLQGLPPASASALWKQFRVNSAPAR